MASSAQPKQILLIDKQDHWRKLSTQALARAGYEVQSLHSYAYPSLGGNGTNATPDLIILGCASIGPDEHELISRVLDHKDHLLVLCTSLPWKVMRSLFLLGADDVADKPYDPDSLIRIVDEVIESTSPRDSYQALERSSTS